MTVIFGIPYKSFKDRLKITKEYIGKAKIEVMKEIVYIEFEVMDYD